MSHLDQSFGKVQKTNRTDGNLEIQEVRSISILFQKCSQGQWGHESVTEFGMERR